MKRLLYLIPLLIFFACKKEVREYAIQQPKADTLVLEVEPLAGGQALRRPTNPGKGHKPPPDTIIVTPPQEPPPPYYGARIYYVEFNGCYVNSSVWGSFYAEPSNIPDDEQQRLIDKVSAQYSDFSNFI